MADKSPLKATYNGSDTNGLAEFASGDTVAIADGGTGATTASGAKSNLGITDTTPAGSNTEVQYNNSGAFGASASLKFDGSTLTTKAGGSGDAFVVQDASGDTLLSIRNDGYTNLTRDATDNSLLQVWNNGSGAMMSMTCQGRLGIGTQSPAKLLSLSAGTDTTAGTDPIARFERTGSSQTGVTLRSNSIDGLILRADSAGLGAVHSYEDLAFYTGATPGSSYGTMRMRIDSATGNIGIGTTPGDSAVHIYKGSAGSVTAISGAALTIEDDAASYLQFLNPADTEAGIIFGRGTDNNHAGMFYGSDEQLYFSANNAERMRITSGGALLLGCTATDTDESNYKVVHIGDQSSLICLDGTSAGTDAYFGHNVHLTGGGWKHTITDEAEYIGMYNGQIAFNTAASASADAAFNGATRLLIGSDGAITHTVSATTAYDPDATRSPSLNLENIGTDTDNQYAGIFFSVGSGGSNGQASIDCVHNGTGNEADLAFATRHSSGNVQERMRLHSNGDITFNNGVGWMYVQGFQATTTWTDTNVTMGNKAQLIMWLSHNNFNGATEGRQWGMAYCSGNGEGSVNYFRSTINVIGSNASGWHNYASISLREKPDSGSTAGRILQVQRASNSTNGYFHLYKMSVANSGL